mmetsp:Transcript_79561/g.257666  ORF Transcript_79561/g.257666 Transcript_79561/m.257666 type:complete len:203 (-) Transcript_79561:744-1352(-)
MRLGPEVAGGAAHRAEDAPEAAHVVAGVVGLVLGPANVVARGDEAFPPCGVQGPRLAHVDAPDEAEGDSQQLQAPPNRPLPLHALLEAQHVQSHVLLEPLPRYGPVHLAPLPPNFAQLALLALVRIQEGVERVADRGVRTHGHGVVLVPRLVLPEVPVTPKLLHAHPAPVPPEVAALRELGRHLHHLPPALGQRPLRQVPAR